MAERMSAAELHGNLCQFTGTEQYHGHPMFGKFRWTDGVNYLAEKGMALWLVTDIAAYQSNPKVRKEPFQVWTLTPKGKGAVLTMARDSGAKPIVSQEYEYTDFPFNNGEAFELWVVDGVALLPSEY